MSNRPEFWSNVTSAPKRKYAFQVYVGNLPAFLCYSATKPTITIGTVKVNFLNHEFKHPGRISYNDIELKYYDTEDVEGSTAKLIYKMLLDSGYTRPETERNLTTIAKRRVVAPLSGENGSMRIVHIDADGNPLETWTLKNGWFSEVSFDNVDYASDEPVSITMKVVYDYPILDGVNIVRTS
jgi:hypothetical protein